MVRRSRSPGSGPPVTGDLFTHFGVDEHEATAGALPAPVVARACSGCDWYLTGQTERSCPQCGASLVPAT
jgi:hypothetical protein